MSWEILKEPGTGRPLLGKEVYKEVPGDLRQQYFAVIDRTNSTLDVTGAGGVGPRPFFTTLESVPVPENWSGAAPTPASIQFAAVQDTPNGPVTVFADGVAIPINPGDTLYLGVGAEQEAVTVGSVAYDTTTKLATVTLPLPATIGTYTLKKVHAPGSAVTNAVLGNPGPQPGFKYWDTKYQPLLPAVTRIR